MNKMRVILISGALATIILMAELSFYKETQAGGTNLTLGAFARDIKHVVYSASPRGNTFLIAKSRPQTAYDEILKIFGTILKNEYGEKYGFQVFEREVYIGKEYQKKKSIESSGEKYTGDPNELNVVLYVDLIEGKDINLPVANNIAVTYLDIYKHNEKAPNFDTMKKIPLNPGIQPNIFAFESGNKEQFEKSLKNSIRWQMDNLFKIMPFGCPPDHKVCKDNHEQE